MIGVLFVTSSVNVWVASGDVPFAAVTVNVYAPAGTAADTFSELPETEIEPPAGEGVTVPIDHVIGGVPEAVNWKLPPVPVLPSAPETQL
jgi:hypothetical protein